MRITQVALNAAGTSKWVPHDTYQTPPAITLAGFVSSGATLTWAVQYTCDDVSPAAARQIVLSQTTTVITVSDNGPLLQSTLAAAPTAFGHGLSVGDDVILMGTQIGVDGEYAVASVVSATQYTLTSAISQTASSSVAQAISARVFTHATLTGQTGRATGNYAFPVKASRLVISSFTSGVAWLEILQGGLSS